MDPFRRAPIFIVIAALSFAATSVAGQGKVTVPTLSQAEMEAFLLKARIMSKRDAGAGVTGSLRVTLSDGPLSLFDTDGSAIIIHGNPDQGITGEPKSGVSGGPRAACGVITKK